jgi:adenosylcobinamide-phosphate synthase
LLPFNKKAAGSLMAVLLIGLTWTLTRIVCDCAFFLHSVLGMAVQTILLYTCISARGLSDAALNVYHVLRNSGLNAGRKAVSMIVGREVDQLDEEGVSRATVETIAENLVDGVVSPLFFFVIGGAPLAMAFKMVNTLDSMIGYKNDRYLYFGRCAARIDDVVNYIPARLAVPFVAMASRWLNNRCKQTLKTALRDGRLHASPNAGFPEASFAGALKLWLGGPNIYHGRLVKKPVIGEGFAKTRPVHILLACRLMLATSVLFLIAAAAALLLFSVR